MIDTRAEYQDLFSVYWPVGLGVLVLVWLAVAFALVRYRAGRAGEPNRKSDSRAEYVYGAGLACIAALLVFLTFQTMSDSRADEEPSSLAGARLPPGAETVKVNTVAAKWNWRFEYPEYGIVQAGAEGRPARLVVPADTPVEFAQTSRDVIHSFWIPELRFKRDAFPGRTHRFALEFDRTGFYDTGRCAEYCGLRHSYMTFYVDVLEPAEFRAWVEENRGAGSGR